MTGAALGLSALEARAQDPDEARAEAERTAITQALEHRVASDFAAAVEVLTAPELGPPAAWTKAHFVELAWTQAFAGQRTDALATLDEAKALGHQGVELDSARARITSWDGQHRSALEQWARLVRDHPEAWDLAAGYGAAAEAAQRRHLARREFERALELNPEANEAREGLARMDANRPGAIEGAWGLQRLNGEDSLSARLHLHRQVHRALTFDLDYQSGTVNPSVTQINTAFPHWARVGARGTIGRRGQYTSGLIGTLGPAPERELNLGVELGLGVGTTRAGTFNAALQIDVDQSQGPSGGGRAIYERGMTSRVAARVMYFWAGSWGPRQFEHAALAGANLRLAPNWVLDLAAGARQSGLGWGWIANTQLRWQLTSRWSYVVEASATSPRPQLIAVRTGLSVTFGS